MEKFLKLPSGKISKLADHERKEEVKKKLGEPPTPLLKEVRELILRKCAPEKEKQVRAIFEKQPFGELERLVIQKLLDVVKNVAKEELESEDWLRLVARLIGRSYEHMRVIVLEFLDTDVFNVSVQDCDSFLDPLIESWDIDLANLCYESCLEQKIRSGPPEEIRVCGKGGRVPSEEEPGFKRFLRDRVLSGDATEAEIDLPEAIEIQRKAAHSALLLPGITKPERSAEFPNARARRLAFRTIGRSNAQTYGGKGR